MGDLDKPKLVFFFDEAHLLFDDAPPELREKIEQVVRLIRSKGVGVYFVTQNPLDLPETVLGQLGNRVQHALRAFTPRDQKAVRTAAETFRPNPAFDAAEAITQLAVGEALVSTLDATGTPQPGGAGLRGPAAQPALAALAGGAAPGDPGLADRRQVRRGGRSRLGLRAALAAGSGDPAAAGAGAGARGAAGAPGRAARATSSGRSRRARSGRPGTQLGREIIRGVLGSIFGGGRRSDEEPGAGPDVDGAGPAAALGAGGHDKIGCTGLPLDARGEGGGPLRGRAQPKMINPKTNRPHEPMTQLCLACHAEPADGRQGARLDREPPRPPVLDDDAEPAAREGAGGAAPRRPVRVRLLPRPAPVEPQLPLPAGARAKQAPSMTVFCGVCHPRKADPDRAPPVALLEHGRDGVPRGREARGGTVEPLPHPAPLPR